MPGWTLPPVAVAWLTVLIGTGTVSLARVTVTRATHHTRERETPMSSHTCAEVQYRDQRGAGVHSDMCFDGPADADAREFLHACLDEFLDNHTPGSTGEHFTVGH